MWRKRASQEHRWPEPVPGARAGVDQRRGGLVRALIRLRAPAQSTSSGRPIASRSIQQWRVVGRHGGPFRASRSISASTTRAATGSEHEEQVDPHPEVLVEHARPVVPPRVPPGLELASAIRVGETKVHEGPSPRLVPARETRVLPWAAAGVPHVDGRRGHVEVPTDQEGPTMRRRRVECAGFAGPTA